MIAAAHESEVIVEIGGMPIAVHTDSTDFREILRNRYGGFVNPSAEAVFDMEVEIVPSGTLASAIDPDGNLNVNFADGRWVLERGDFRAELDPALRHGHIRQTATLMLSTRRSESCTRCCSPEKAGY